MFVRQLLYWVTGFLPARYIDHEGQPYLERYYVATLPGIRVYVHRFVGSDPDGVHDHPFRHSLSLILAGWYFEDRLEQGRLKRRVRRWCNRIGPKDFHRVVLPGQQDVWTLFLHTARVKPWGFLRPEPTALPGAPARYVDQSRPEDPPFSQWHRRAPAGRVLRARERLIPLGQAFRPPGG